MASLIRKPASPYLLAHRRCLRPGSLCLQSSSRRVNATRTHVPNPTFGSVISMHFSLLSNDRHFPGATTATPSMGAHPNLNYQGFQTSLQLSKAMFLSRNFHINAANHFPSGINSQALLHPASSATINLEAAGDGVPTGSTGRKSRFAGFIDKNKSGRPKENKRANEGRRNGNSGGGTFGKIAGQRGAASVGLGSDFKSDSSDDMEIHDENQLSTPVDEDWAESDEIDESNEYEYIDVNPKTEALTVWHQTKEEEFNQLSSRTNEMLQSSSSDVKKILSLMQEWNDFLSSITTGLHSLSGVKRKHPQRPPSDFISSMMYDGAEQTQKLLMYLVDSKKSSPKQEVKAYKIAMSAWSHTYHPSSGDNCESILEMYGERYGGDMNYMPPISSYQTVLAAHDKSCSTYFLEIEREKRLREKEERETKNVLVGEAIRRGDLKDKTPGEKALTLLNILTDAFLSGDMFLKPNIETHSNAISVVRNTLLDWKFNRRLKEGKNDVSVLETELASGALDALKMIINEIGDMKEGEKIQLSTHQWHSAIRAYADCLAIVSRMPPGSVDEETTADTLLTDLEDLISQHASMISDAFEKSSLQDDVLKNEVQRVIEEAYTNSMLSGLILSKDKGKFPDFRSSLNNAEMSEAIFSSMKDRSANPSTANSYLFPYPTADHYYALIECWCETLRNSYVTPDANRAMEHMEQFPHQKAQSLLDELEQMQAERANSHLIDGSIYSRVIWAWCQIFHWPSTSKGEKLYHAANTADNLLREIKEKHSDGRIHLSGDGDVTKMFNYVFRLHTKLFKGKKDTMTKSLDLFNFMQHWHKESDMVLAKPNSYTFGLILKTIGNSNLQKAGSIAKSMLFQMENFGVTPSEKHYLSTIRAFCRVGRNDVPDAIGANSILTIVRDKYAEDMSVKPTAAMYSAVISAYTRSGNENFSMILKMAEQPKKLYKKTNDPDFQPDNAFYSTILDAMSKVKDFDESKLSLALDMLDQLEQRYDSGEDPTPPNRHVYTNVLNAIAKAKPQNGPKMAEEIVHRMDKRSRELNDMSIKPDKIAFTALLQVFWRCQRPDSVKRAQKWLDEMVRRYENGDKNAKPNRVAYTVLINCWWSSPFPEGGEEAEKILDLMEKKSRGGESDCRPDAFVYASVINTYGRSKSDDKILRIWQVYQRMKDSFSRGNIEARPNNTILTSIINTCGYTHGRKIAQQNGLNILLECIKELKSEKYIVPNPKTFKTLLNAVKYIIEDDSKRRPISATIFELCCREGLVDQTVLDALKFVQPGLYEKLPFYREGVLRMEEIPPKWSCNVKKQRRN